MKKLNYIYLFLLIFLTPLSSFSQTETNVPWLMNFAEEKLIQSKREKAEAEEFARLNNLPIRMVDSFGREVEIMRLDNGRPVYYITDNIGAAYTTRADKLWPGGGLGLNLDGTGYDKLGEWDGGKVRTTHQEFMNTGSSRVTQMDGATTVSNHSTHVAGTLIAHGVVANAKGMGYNGALKAYEWNNDDSEMSSAASAGMEISNHSYGLITGWYTANGYTWTWYGASGTEDYYFGFYDSEAQSWDQIAYNAPNYLIVKSAGNDRGEGPDYAGSGGNPEVDGGTDGYDCISHGSVAKNVLTVGAVNEVLNYTGPTSVVMSSFSCWGPIDDGRIKPDVVAKGVAVYSSVGTTNSSYDTYNGTSMASPNTAGTLALLQKHYQNKNSGSIMRSATLKALVIHTADEAGDHDGPDYKFGWGLVNAERAALKITEDVDEQNVIDQLSLTQGGTYTRDVSVSGNSPLRVTIVWTDPAGTPVTAQLNPPDIMLVNDLDLTVTSPSKTTFYPYKLDKSNPSAAATVGSENNVDNVEMVYIANPSAGTYTITVNHDGTLSGGSQAFSIVISGINEFTTAPSCPSGLYYPSNAATGIPLNFYLSWSPVENADNYLIYMGTDGGGITTPTNLLNGQNSGSALYYISDLSPNTTYFVQVVSQNNQGSSSGCSIW